MKEPIYIKALKMSWDLAWRHKWLWVFGMFAALLGQMGIIDLVVKLVLAVKRFQAPTLWIYISQAISYSEPVGASSSLDQWVLMICIIAIFVLVAALLAFVATVSQGALVYAASRYARVRHVLPHAEEAWYVGVKHFWRLLAVNIVKKLVFGFIILWIAWLSAYALLSTEVSVRLSFVALLFIATVIGIILSFLVIYAAGYIVVENYRLWPAVKSAWSLFIKHPMVSIEVGFLLLIINAVVAVGVLAGMYILFLPTIFTWLLAIMLNSKIILLLGMLAVVLLLLVFMVFVGSVLSVFTISVWTYLFMRMHNHGVASRVSHWARGK